MNTVTKYDIIARHPYQDRFFSQVVRHFLSFFLAKHLNKTHIHWAYEDTEIDTLFNTIFDITKITDKIDTYHTVRKYVHEKKAITKPDQDLVKHFSINDIFTEENVELLRSSYHYFNHTPKFTPNHTLNVAVHIRRGDITKYPSCSRFTNLDFFEKHIRKIHRLWPHAIFHIYSDSFLELRTGGAKVIYHYNDDVVRSMYDMSQSHIFIMSIGSNMSYFAALLSKGILFFDKEKLVECFNNLYNIYWSSYRAFIYEEEEFYKRIHTYHL